jgi:hypothetical protein
MQKGEYQVREAEDGLSLSVLFVRAITSRSFDKKILCKIMGMEYREWDDTALEMQVKNVCPVNGLFWGEPHVVRLRWKCMGTPTAVNKHDYLTEYKVRDKRGVWHVQCDCIVIMTVKKAEERTQAELEVATSYVDLFGIIDSSQSQRSDNTPSPPHHDARRDRHQQQGTRWTTTTMMSTTRSNSLTRSTTRRTTETEGEDTVATEEGNRRGGTSGSRNT